MKIPPIRVPRPSVRRPRPKPDAHREEILKELGYTDAQIRALASEGAI